MRDLERELRDIAVEWPATPDLAAAVRARIEPRRRRTPWRARVAVALAVLLGATMAVEPARSAILEFLGLKSAKIERREPTATPTPTPPPDAPLGEGFDLGTPTTPAGARRLAGIAPVVPGAGLGAPDEVWADEGRVSFVYGPRRAKLLITEYRAMASPFIEKAAGAGTKVEQFDLHGDTAYRLSGRPHGFAYAEPGKEPSFEEQRLAGPTLLVEHQDLLIRVEGRLSRARAIAIAESIVDRAG
jgi:hypothetical protein